MVRPSCFLLLLLWVGISQTATGVEMGAGRPASVEPIASYIRKGVSNLNELYWSSTLGIWLDHPGDDLRAHYDGRRNPPWWPSANAVEVLIDFMTATGSSDYDGAIESLYDLQKDHRTRRARIVAELKRRNQWSDADESRSQRQREAAEVPPKYYRDFENEYLDDSGWWGITWLKMYDRTGSLEYLQTAKAIHAHIAGNWKSENGGGIMWSEDQDKQHPNTITNTLFLILSARLHKKTQEQLYLDWGEKALSWFHSNALYDGVAVVDGPRHKDDYWSYNQGTFVGGLLALYEATGQSKYLHEAVDVTKTVLQRSGLVSPGGVLVEKLGTQGDASLFKGIFARYLAQLRDVLRARKLHPHIAEEIDRCLRTSGAAVVRDSLQPDGLFGAEWHEEAKDRTTNFNTQVSALAALVATLARPDLPAPALAPSSSEASTGDK